MPEGEQDTPKPDVPAPAAAPDPDVSVPAAAPGPDVPVPAMVPEPPDAPAAASPPPQAPSGASPPPQAPAMMAVPSAAPAVVAPPPVLPVVVKRRRRWPLFAVIAGVVALAVIGTAVGIPLYRKLTAPPPTERVLAAAAALATAPALHLTGSVWRAENGSFETFDARVGADTTTAGTISIGGGRADFLVGPRLVRLRGDRRSLLAIEPDVAEYGVGTWLELEPATLNVAFSELTPRNVANRMRDGLRANGSGKYAAVPADGFPTRLGRTAVTPYRLPTGRVAFVTADAPYRLVGFTGKFGISVEGELTAEISVLTSKRFATDYATQERAAGEAPTQPAHYLPDPSSEKRGSCDKRFCAESAIVSADGGDTARPGHVVGLFSSDAAGKHVVGTCQAKLPTLAPNGSGRAWCTTTSASWRKWAADGKTFWFRLIPLSPGWQGDDVHTVLHLLGTGALNDDVVTGYQLSSTGPGEFFGVMDSLVGQGWSAAAAWQATTNLADSGALGIAAPMLRAGTLSVDPKAGPGALEAGSLPFYREARRRYEAHGGKLAVGGYTDPSGTHHTGHLYDVTRRRVVTTVPLTADSMRGLRSQWPDAVERCRNANAPEGFGRDLVLVATPRSPLYWLGADDVARTLRAAGVAGKDLAGIAALTVVTRTGAVAVRASDLG
ncbi:hypothetical protein [Actinocatenispora comari]|uniref:Uncharacterized protein n=1 Tax=Actinocatenispora comari TaxID=2807577 RepID=A0A8J4ELI8_9ACTN|nr:hypothetical protein [Actinocatenispora comari]GIL25659.1 hypothetical protein NUM_09130 [Actinocatenispora comari]